MVFKRLDLILQDVIEAARIDASGGERAQPGKVATDKTGEESACRSPCATGGRDHAQTEMGEKDRSGEAPASIRVRQQGEETPANSVPVRVIANRCMNRAGPTRRPSAALFIHLVTVGGVRVHARSVSGAGT